MSRAGLVHELRANAREAERLHEQSRRLLVDSVRAGAAAGLTQRQISKAIGRSQPEVSRLLRFKGHTDLARSLVVNRRGVVEVLAGIGAQNISVFGSVARGDDRPGSDVDLLADFARAPSLFELSRVEQELAGLLGVPVDVVPRQSLRANIAARVMAEAIAL